MDILLFINKLQQVLFHLVYVSLVNPLVRHVQMNLVHVLAASKDIQNKTGNVKVTFV